MINKQTFGCAAPHFQTPSFKMSQIEDVASWKPKRNPTIGTEPVVLVHPILGLSRKLIPGGLHVFISGSDFSEPYEFRGLPLIFCDKLLFNWPLSIIWVCLRWWNHRSLDCCIEHRGMLPCLDVHPRNHRFFRTMGQPGHNRINMYNIGV